MDDNQVRRLLWAFADGELDVERNLAVLERLAMDPQATRRVEHQQQLRRRVAEAMDGSAMTTPAALRAQLEAMAQDVAPAPLPEQAAQPRWDVAGILRMPLRGPWLGGALAAVLVLAVGLVWLIGRDAALPANAGAGNVAYGAEVLTASTVARFDRRHMHCGSHPESLGPAELFPHDIAALPAATAAYLGQPDDSKLAGRSLDLSVLGYEYVRAGRCATPGRGSVMVLYRAAEGSGQAGTISLWMKAYDGSPELAEGRLVSATDGHSPRALLVWRRDGVAYFLMGDGSSPVEQAAFLLGGSASCGLPER